ncbi:MAG: DNA methyltransferase [Candidatus Heimdallarchaeota archaeon]
MPSLVEERIIEFQKFVKNLAGKEKQEAQTFLENLFKAFGHTSIIESGGKFEADIKIDKKTYYADLFWPEKVLIEMKSRKEDLNKHVNQAKFYWFNIYKSRPKYVILCNFDEFWIFDWNNQPDPIDIVKLENLVSRWRALAFLIPDDKVKPIFDNDRVAVTENAAKEIAKLYLSLIERGINNENAQRFTLQCLVCLFADDTGLFPVRGFFAEVIQDCINGSNSYDTFKLLFSKMNSSEKEFGGKFKEVKYFDGGIFQIIHPIDLKKSELQLLYNAALQDWSKIQPAIFGNIFEASLRKEDRHKLGAHFTRESDIMKIIEPSLLRPIRNKINQTQTLKDLESIWTSLGELKILDPACGSGNFLYVAFRELKSLEIDLIRKMVSEYPSLQKKIDSLQSKIKSTQFYGIDTNSFAVELAMITLSFAKKNAIDTFIDFNKQRLLSYEGENPLPFDNLNSNFIVDDALFIDWPEADIIIGNPPFQSKNKMIEEFGPEYVEKLREKYPSVNGRIDYCVYWFRKSHNHLKTNGRAGLVGTNTIRQTYSKIDGLDFIINNNGVIIEAVSTMPWSGEAQVHVSIVNWVKCKNNKHGTRKLLFYDEKDSDNLLEEYDLQWIPSSLSPKLDVISAKELTINKNSKTCYQGQTHGHIGFILNRQQTKDIFKKEPEAKKVIFPYLNGNAFLGTKKSQPDRLIIDFQSMSLFEAQEFKTPFKIVKQKVLPTIKQKADEEKKLYEKLAKKVSVRQNHLKKWWLFWRARTDLIGLINNVPRYIVCSRVAKRSIFDFVSSNIKPNDALIAFPLSDDYSFGILQSSFHWEWIKARCSTLKGDYRYTITTIYNTFPWPQYGADKSIEMSEEKSLEIELCSEVARKARNLRMIRNEIRTNNHLSLREIYRISELPGDNKLNNAQELLDQAVLNAYNYGIKESDKTDDPLMILLKLNESCFISEQKNKQLLNPGLPEFCKNNDEFYSNDCIDYKI